MVNHQSSRWFRYYAVALFIAGIPVLAISLRYAPAHISGPLVILMVAAFLSENAALPLPQGGTTSVGFALIVAAALLFGPVGAGLVALSMTTMFREIRAGKPLLEIMGNAGLLTLSSVLPAWAYLLFGGRQLIGPSGRVAALTTTSDFPSIVPAIVLLIAGFLVLNASFVTIALWLRDSVSPLDFLRSAFPWAFSVQATLGVLGVAIAQVMTVHPLALVLLVFPLIIARQTYQRSQALQYMYKDTVRSLIAALEAKDPYTRGHSERVARYAASAARHMGLPEERVERIHMAAQLHDLGKVAVSSEVLGKPSGLSAEEYEEIYAHPELGASIVAGVPALGDITNIVRHHHERHDGAGYATGLAGEDIPLEARVLAIADSYDAMTTERAYRAGMGSEDALREIVSCAGSQFDPGLVEHFVAAAQRGFNDE